MVTLDRRSPASPCPSCPEILWFWGIRKEETLLQAGLSCLSLAASLHGRVSLRTFLFAAVSPPPVKFCPLLSHGGSVPCPQDPHWPQGKQGRDWSSEGSDLDRFLSLSRHQIMLKALGSGCLFYS